MLLRIARVLLPGALAYALAAAPLEADDPVSTAVSFNREIIRIVQRTCEPCHASGGLAMSLSDYRDARAWGRAIREELVEHRMPPALVARGYGRYETDPSLTAREMATFLTWLDGGMPRGDDADLPPRPYTAGDTVDDIEDAAGLRLPLPAQTVPAGEELVVRRVTIDAGAAAGRAIARVEVRPGNRGVLRGALVFAGPPRDALDADARGSHLWVGSWLPWQHTIVPPQAYAFHLAAHATLVVELYYRGAQADPVVDRSAIDVLFAPTTARGHIDNVVIEATPAPQRVDAVRLSASAKASADKKPDTRDGQTVWLNPDTTSGQVATRMRGSAKLLQPTAIWAIQPVVTASVSSMELRAERPDKSVEVLMWIPTARADWPLALVMQPPLQLPAGSVVSVVAEMDASVTAAPRPRVTLSILR
jgi:hypothetical protein